MSIDIGIVGLPQSGKTTIFKALTGSHAGTAGTGGEARSPQINTVKVPDSRLDVLADMFQPEKVVPAEARYFDIGATARGASLEKGFAGEFLNRLGNVDTLIAVVRAFRDDSLPHPAGSIDVPRDIATLNLELAFSDLLIIERRLERIAVSLKAARPTERQAFLHEEDILHNLKTDLEAEKPIRDRPFDVGEARQIANFQFLTAKPLLIIVNIGEEQLPQAAAMEEELNHVYAAPRCRVVALSGKLEMELAQMAEEEAAEFRKDFGLAESGLARAIRLSYELSGMISFFTIGPDEVRAWAIRQGTTAVKAAGKIHTDMEKGFIRAEGINYEDLVKAGGMAEARKQGRLRLEGKDYIVRDGDVITFLFNV